MLYLKADEPRTLTFEVDIRGVGKGELKGYVRLFINDSEHGFPVSIDDGVITADIPPLTEVIRLKTLEDGDIIEAKLDLMTDQHIFTPWEGEVKVSVPMGIKAKLSNETMRPVNAGGGMVAKVIETKQDKEATKKSSKKETVQEFDTSEEKMLKVSQEDYKKDLMAMVADTIKQMGLVPAPKPEALMEKEKDSSRTTKKTKTPSKKVVRELEEQAKANQKDLLMKKLENITEEGVYKYMERAGTKNPKIQELLYEQAVAAAGSGKPYKVLQQVVKILKKRQ
jgi:hypothetical protein